MSTNVPATVSKSSLYKRVTSAAKEKRAFKEKGSAFIATMVTAGVGGYLYGKFPEFRAIGTQGGTAPGIDSRFIAGTLILLLSMSKKTPRYVQDVAEVMFTTAAWDFARAKGESA